MLMSAGGILAASGPALAGDGQPSPWQIGFQRAATPIMEQITSFHDFVTIIIVLVALFVLGLLVYVMVSFNEKRHPQSSRTTHNTALEIAWTVIPILILVAIAIPSFRLLFAQYDFPKPDLVITATGHQWYWTYVYPDYGDLTFDATENSWDWFDAITHGRGQYMPAWEGKLSEQDRWNVIAYLHSLNTQP